MKMKFEIRITVTGVLKMRLQLIFVTAFIPNLNELFFFKKKVNISKTEEVKFPLKKIF